MSWKLNLAVALSLTGPSLAQPANPIPAVFDRLQHVLTWKTDKTETNPLNFQRSASLLNEVQFFDNIGYQNITTLQFTQSISDEWNVRVRAPIIANDLWGYNLQGMGDLNIRPAWAPHITPKLGILLTSEFGFNTSTSNLIGSGKNTVAPSAQVVFFLPHQMLIAPAYQYTFNYAGDPLKLEVRKSAIDLYITRRNQRLKTWLTFDPALTLDHAHSRTYGTLELEGGHILGRIGTGTASLYLRPGISVGGHRPHKWNFEAGFRVVGW